MTTFLPIENADRRILGAVRFLDATTQLKVAQGLRVQADTAILRLNRAGLFTIWSALGLEPHERAFDSPPLEPAPRSVSVRLTISDTVFRYVPRTSTLKLPRDPATVDADHLNSLFQPVDVFLYPAPAAQVFSGWALIRATVKKSGTEQRLAGALIRVVRTSDGVLLASGLADQRGEALVAVPGIPVTSFGAGGGGAVLSTEVDVTIETVFDPAASGEPDPDDLETRKAALVSASLTGKLASGRELITDLTVATP